MHCSNSDSTIKVNLLLNFETRTSEFKVGTKLMISCFNGTVVVVQLLTLVILFVFVTRIGVNELQNLHYLPRASEPREILAEDRTRCHADHVGHGFDRQTTAAVGVLKAVHVGER